MENLGIFECGSIIFCDLEWFVFYFFLLGEDVVLCFYFFCCYLGVYCLICFSLYVGFGL